MNTFVKNLVLNFFSSVKVYPTRLTDNNQLQSLLDKLKPISCSKGLIRLGPRGDGGYLVPNDLEGIRACFSPGVDRISGFEKDCADRGMRVFLADKSVEKPTESHELFQFTKKYLGVTTDDSFMTLDDWVASSLPESDEDLLLQIDIEGFENEVFLAASDILLKRFRIIVVEFHFLDHLWSKPFFDLGSRVFEKLLQTHSCVHNHPNNFSGSVKIGGIEIPLVTEMTFLRNDRVTDTEYVTSFPHPLDYDCTSKPSLVLPECWYK